MEPERWAKLREKIPLGTVNKSSLETRPNGADALLSDYHI